MIPKHHYIYKYETLKSDKMDTVNNLYKQHKTQTLTIIQHTAPKGNNTHNTHNNNNAHTQTTNKIHT